MAVLLGAIVPQGIGFLVYWFLGRRKFWARTPSVLIAPVVFFLISNAFWGVQAAAIRAAGERVCGAFGAAAVFSTLFGSLIHLFIAALVLATFSYLSARRQKVSVLPA